MTLTADAIFNERSDVLRRRLLRRWPFRAYMLSRVPLAGIAGLRLLRLDETECRVVLPGGWRNRNPFGSTYFASQSMAAEASTGAPALVLVAGAAASVSPILREVHGVFHKKIVGPSEFCFEDLAGMKAAIDRAVASGEGERFAARSVARQGDGSALAEFELVWSFKRRA